MEVRQTVHSEHARSLGTEGPRRHFLVENMFKPDEATLSCSQGDRTLAGTLARAFIQGWVGGNHVFKDVDHLPMTALH